LDELIAFHTRKKSEASLVLRSSGPVLNVDVNDREEITDIRSSLKQPGFRKCLFTGIYAVEKSLLQYIEPGKVESIIPVFIRRIQDKSGSIAGVIIDKGMWQDIGSLEIYNSIKSKNAEEFK
jgi:NDP-sugar pyrophosphorylase family protein